jgi:type IV secretion system protein TrbG
MTCTRVKSQLCAVPVSIFMTFALPVECRAANDNLPPSLPAFGPALGATQQLAAKPGAEDQLTADQAAYIASVLNHRSHRKTSRTKSRRATSNGPTSRVARANLAARAEPVADQYINAIQIYPYSDGTLYRLYAAVGRITDIKLQAGETLIDKAAGDTVRWVVGDTTSGAQKTAQTHVLVKPVAANLKTNLLITTTRRTYHLELISTRETYMASLSWHYPQSELPDRDTAGIMSSSSADDEIAPVADPTAFNFDYGIAGPRVAWKPVRVFDNGRQTFIQFGKTLDAGEAAPLFVTDNGQAVLVNYRQKGNAYSVDRLFDAAELRLGSGKQQIVRIVRLDARKQKPALRLAGARP